MKRLLFCTLFLAGFVMTAQTTHHLDWFSGISVQNASLTIDEGDTVIWTFTDAAQHSVTADAGSAESFDSGILSAGSTYSYVFTVVGDNPYHCNVHPGMVGTITVEPLGVDERSIRAFGMVPNPATTEIAIELPSPIENLSIRVFDMSGRMIYSQPMEGIQSAIDVSAWGKGVYMVELSNGAVSKTKRFIKQ